MKRFAAFLAALMGLCASTHAQFTPNEIRIQQRDAANTSFFSRVVLPTSTDGLLIYNASTQLPNLVTLGSNLSIIGGVLDAAGGSAPTSGQIISALGYTPYNAANPAGYLSSITGGQVTTALGFTPYSATNPLGFISGITGPQVSTALGYTPYDASNPAGYVTAGGMSSTLASYATTASMSTALAGKMNTPTGTISQYLRGDGSVAAFPAVGTGSVTSVTAGTGLSGGTITTSGTISLPSVGTAGTYNGSVTTDAQGRVTAGAALTINDSPGRSLVTSTSATGFQISGTRVARVCYEGGFATTSTIGGPASASVFLETSDTNSTTPGDWTTKARQTYSNTITLAVVLNQVQANNWAFCRDIPAGKFVRIRSGSISGTASVSLNAEQQETLF